MNENEQPSHDLLEEAIHAFQQMSVPERPAGAETLALLRARQGDLVQTPSIPHPSPRRFRMYAIISSTAAAVLLSVGLALYLWNNSPPAPKPEPVPVAVTKAPGQAKGVAGKEPRGENRVQKEERSSLADPPREENRVPKEERSSAAVDSLENRLKESPVIVVAAAKSSSLAPPPTIPGDSRDVLIEFTVKRVLKGKLAAKVITVRMTVPPRPDQIVGQDWVVWLSHAYLAGKSQSAPLSTAELEAKFKEMIAKEKK